MLRPRRSVRAAASRAFPTRPAGTPVPVSAGFDLIVGRRMHNQGRCHHTCHASPGRDHISRRDVDWNPERPTDPGRVQNTTTSLPGTASEHHPQASQPRQRPSSATSASPAPDRRRTGSSPPSTHHGLPDESAHPHQQTRRSPPARQSLPPRFPPAVPRPRTPSCPPRCVPHHAPTHQWPMPSDPGPTSTSTSNCPVPWPP